ncbi:hypothetical protein [Archangium lipolyticum]|uniref:hypothetical protein n=1 Tax=Archangium lipolyticum TaxID=2970465 RepID=UPI00214A0D02|nr:hypothetical protein [Archangium lipolyticum]
MHTTRTFSPPHLERSLDGRPRRCVHLALPDLGHSNPANSFSFLDALADYRVELLPWSEARMHLYAAIEEMGLIRRA